MRATYPGCTPPPAHAPCRLMGTLVPQLKTSSPRSRLWSHSLATQGAPSRHQARASCQPGAPPQNHEGNDGARKPCPRLILAGPDVNCILVKVPKSRAMTSLCVWTGRDHWALQQQMVCTLGLRLCGHVCHTTLRRLGTNLTLPQGALHLPNLQHNKRHQGLDQKEGMTF